MKYSVGAQSLRKTGLKIEVDIYKYAAVSAETLARADQETTRILERTGVATT